MLPRIAGNRSEALCACVGYSGTVKHSNGIVRDARMHLSRALNRSLAPPDWVSLNLTMKCNLACSMCTTCYDQPNELSTREVKDVIDQTALWGVKVFNPLGGEPFVRRDLEEILAYACNKDFYITLTTNGTLISKKRAALLAKIPPSKLHFNISLDGPQAINDAIRGKGMYAKAIQGYENIREADEKAGNPRRKILVNTLIHDKNLDEIVGFLDEQSERGFQGVQLLNLFRHGEGEPEDSGGIWIGKERLGRLEQVVSELVERVRHQGAAGYQILNSEKDLELIPAYYRDELEPLDAPCWAGWKEFYIHSDGSAIMCDGELEFLNGRFGTVRESTLQELWHSAALKERRQVVKQCSTPCIQNCYLRRSSDSGSEIVSRGLSQLKEQAVARMKQLSRVLPNSEPERNPGILRLELADMADWADPWRPAAKRRFDALMAKSPAPIERCYADPFLWYQYRDRDYVDFGRGFLGREVIRRLIADLERNGLGFETVDLSWRGEPLLHPEGVLVLQDVLRAVERGVFGQLRITTDARLLNTQIAEVCAQFEVPQTWLIHGNAGEAHEDAVLRNVDYFLSVRNKKQRVIAAWRVDEPLDPFAFVETWASRLQNPWIQAGVAQNTGDGILFLRSDHDHFQATKEARERLEEVAEVLDVFCESGVEAAPRRCRGAESTPVISWDGKVVLCAWDHALANRVGEVTSDSFSRVWSEDTQLKAIRRESDRKGVPGMALCRDCHFVYSPNCTES
jgi:MoaA/NifB/PqqE/SkfB family radical SAM enzyme